MRFQYLKQIADGLAAGDPTRAAAKAVIVAEVDWLHWRIWIGKVENARKSIDRIRAVVHHFRDKAGTRKSIAPSRKLWTALRELDNYLTDQSAWLVNYAERHRAGLRVGTSITEGTATFLVNRRMNKSQQMRWSRRGADLLLQVRGAIYDGMLGSEFGQKIHPPNGTEPVSTYPCCGRIRHWTLRCRHRTGSATPVDNPTSNWIEAVLPGTGFSMATKRCCGLQHDQRRAALSHCARGTASRRMATS
jgi:hypothetical protein